MILDENKYHVTNNGQRKDFLIGDSGQEYDRILILGRQGWVAFSRDSEVWDVDGTFKMSLPLFSQVYVIMARRHGEVFPALYALLQNKASSNLC